MRDLSRRLTPGHPNWPGDAPFTLEPGSQMSRGDSVNTAVLCTSTHTGTHVDAPFHYDPRGMTLEDIPLEVYVGRCRVIHATGFAKVPASVIEKYHNLPARVLIYTGQSAHWTHFPQDFAALEPGLIRALSAKGVQLVGTDAPSVDPLESKSLEAHQACRETSTYILEGLVLEGVAEGEYELICLPLPLFGADGAPARAILRDLPSSEEQA